MREFCIFGIVHEGKEVAEDGMIDTRFLSLPLDAVACNGTACQSVAESESDVLAIYETCDVSSPPTWRVTHSSTLATDRVATRTTAKGELEGARWLGARKDQ